MSEINTPLMDDWSRLQRFARKSRGEWQCRIVSLGELCDCPLCAADRLYLAATGFPTPKMVTADVPSITEQLGNEINEAVRYDCISPVTAKRLLDLIGVQMKYKC